MPDAVKESANSRVDLAQIKMVLSDVWNAGRLLVDRDERLKSALVEQVRVLPSHGAGQHVQSLFAEIAKKPGKIIVSNKQSVKGTDYHIAKQLAYSEKLDGVMVDTKSLNRLEKDKETLSKIAFTPRLYADSHVYDLKSEYTTTLNLGEMSADKFAELFSRLTRHSKKISIYDKQIGRGNNVESFLKGIGLISKHWKGSKNFDPTCCSLEINTLVEHHIRKGLESHRTKEVDLIHQQFKKVLDKLVKPLATYLGIPVTLRFKRCEEEYHYREYHARYLKTDASLLHIDTGFDFVNTSSQPRAEPYRECPIQIVANRLLEPWANLDDFLCQTYTTPKGHQG